jgi:hypothetical protein
MKLLVRLFRRRAAPLPVPPAEQERLQRIYRETHRHVADLRRAA